MRSIAAVMALSWLTVMSSWLSAAEENLQPNLVFISADDMGKASVSCFGDGHFSDKDRPENAEATHQENSNAVKETDGLIAFWDFKNSENDKWTSVHDPKLDVQPYPISLRKIGDAKAYSLSSWPYKEMDSSLKYDKSGPFGQAVNFNRGHIYGAVKRSDFDGSLLDLGPQAFTMIAWTKFIGKRHMVAGIWDEGGWDKYAGRRQVALFGGLFGQKGTIAHISATGASSFPQSTVTGSQYARLRAIDGQPFKDNQWVAMAMSYDPQKKEVKAYLNGTMTSLKLDDPVANSVFHHKETQAANPFEFKLPVYSPRNFVLKFNGYNFKQDGVYEHRIHVDLNSKTIAYFQDSKLGKGSNFKLEVDMLRDGKTLLQKPLNALVADSQKLTFSENLKIGDELQARLMIKKEGAWKQVGTQLEYVISEGAPFTFGRALGLGLGSNSTQHGSQLYLDGVAVFNRVLTERELKALSFCD